MTPGRDDRELSQFLFRACHDLRSSVRGIRTHSELLLRDSAAKPPEDLEQRLDMIARSAGRLDLLVDGLARYSIAIDTDQGSFQPVALQVLLRTALAKVDKELKSNDAQVCVGELPRVSGNPDRLLEVFENLLRNPLAHRGTASPHIDISVQDQGADWLLAVRDNGPGVGTAYLESIFKPFERLEGKKKDGPGLGLAIAKAIVERHGGRIWAESKGEGLTVMFTLPKV